MGSCSRCGRSGEVEYGTDGQAYCTSCIFYGSNKQCWRCRMYLPASELQQYKGQLTCPYCIMDMREEDRKHDEPHPDQQHKLEQLSYVETCENCGRNLDSRVYILNGKKLCKRCVDNEKSKWELVSGAPLGPGQKISLAPIIQKKKVSIITKIIDESLYLVRLKKRPNVREVVVYETKAPIARAKPMAERLATLKEEKKPESEGLMPIKQDKKLSSVPAKDKSKEKKDKKNK